MKNNIFALRMIMACVWMILFRSTSQSQSPIPPGATLVKIADGLKQPEGPVWKDGVGLLFSDIQASIIYKWTPADSLQVYLKPSDSSNGLTLDLQGRLILTQMQQRRVSRQEDNGTITPLTSSFRGKRYNRPNDVVVKSDGSIFFTDPDFNIPAGQSKELSFKGVYRISPQGNVQVVDSTFDKPNGICFSPDESKLYVNESPQDKIYVWDVANDSTVANKRLFYTIPASGYADGMKVDSSGNLYCTGPGGVWIISPSGTGLGKIVMPVTPSNCNWGDADRKTLYITGGSSLYKIRLATPTSVQENNPLLVSSFKLYTNYPNPFNPETTITFHAPVSGEVDLRVYDALGKQVALLMKEHVSAGEHQIRWLAKGMASGIYIVRLTASMADGRKTVQASSMLLLK